MAKKIAVLSVVAELNIQVCALTLVGDSPLIVHRFSDKARQMMQDKQAKKASAGREVRDPQAEYEQCFYNLPGGLYGFPAAGFKGSAVRAAKSLPDMSMVDARGFFHIETLPEHGNCVTIARFSKVEMVTDTVRIGRGVADLRYRPYFYDWEVDLKINYNASMVSNVQLAAMFDIAGFSVGVGDWRPEKNGSNGRFHVKTEVI